MEIFDLLNDQGNTIILVTHESFIADHSRRIIRLKDGIVENEEKR
jgi:putative ABC transport system ATP-binding protein